MIRIPRATAAFGLGHAAGHYSKTPPVTTRTISSKTLTVTYTCPSELVCAVAYVLQVPRADARVGHAGVSVRQSPSSDHVVTATSDVGAIKISTSA